jgi:hypothetical protein
MRRVRHSTIGEKTILCDKEEEEGKKGGKFG